jgi:peptide/nickel transport system permease protein
LFRYILKRLFAGVVLIFGVCTLAFFLLLTGAGNVGRQALGVNATHEDVARWNTEHHLDEPAVVQYGRWLGRAVRGDFGTAWLNSQQTVAQSLWQRVPTTVLLVGTALVITALAATVLGIVAAVRGGVVDRTVQALGLLGFAIPGYLVGIFLIWAIALKLHWLPTQGYTKPTESFTQWMRSVTLPVIALAFAGLASVSLQIRGSVRDALDNDYVRTLRSRGLSPRSVVYRHVLRNAAGPALSVLGVQFIGLLGGAVILEQLFNIPGLGSKAVEASIGTDLPMVMGIVAVTAVLVVVVNLLVDILASWLNPKVRLS